MGCLDLICSVGDRVLEQPVSWVGITSQRGTMLFSLFLCQGHGLADSNSNSICLKPIVFRFLRLQLGSPLLECRECPLARAAGDSGWIEEGTTSLWAFV